MVTESTNSCKQGTFILIKEITLIFDLGKNMEEVRQSDFFTDVTLVADGKEFKAHKVVLASQSQLFKTQYAGHCMEWLCW